ncbi:PREDICTED: pectin acetylesterase 11-like [Branchiostoma belcheri]|uniref:Pectin acetylesterase 11-like n=1 Tax=Branchiostoma belcheri TaxID=7741 RepID=A0A6P4Z145_BRABE|nr:PREDICTED: pectin acetylesterase 11-like [Branchiostoma belcheri]
MGSSKMADGCDVAPLIHHTNGKPCALGVRRRNFSLSVICGVLLLSAAVYFVAQVVFPYAIIRSEQGEHHDYVNPLLKLPNWLDNVNDKNGTKNKPTPTNVSLQAAQATQAVKMTQGGGIVVENKLQIDSSDKNNNPEVKMDTPAHLYVLSKEEADKTGAYCLDGSPPAYYFRKGSGTGQKSWIVWLEGGGACVNLTSCYQRSFTNLGSSKGLNHQKTLHGMSSASKDVNPDFYTWNVALLVYCDGFFYAGNREDPVKHSGKSLYFRGRRNLNALIDRLLQTGLGEAERMILGGGSAGAIGTYAGADDVIARLPSSIDVKIVPDSGMFMDLPDRDGVYSFNDSYTSVTELHNASASANKACREAHPQDEQWKCGFPENLVPYEPAPVFMLNYLYDKVALKDVVRTTCRPDQCTGKDMAAVQNYRTTLLQVAQSELTEKDGAFLITCFAHGFGNDHAWTEFTVNNKTVRQAVGDWYFGRSKDNVNVDTGPDLNPTCRNYLSKDTEIQSLWD